MQILTNGLITGIAIAILGLAFAIVYLPTRIMHIGIGAAYTLAPHMAWILRRLGSPWSIAVVLAVGSAAALSLFCEWASHRPLDMRRSTTGAHFIAGLGIYLAITELIAILWGSETKVLRSGIDRTQTFGGVTVTSAQMLVAASGLGILAIFFIWLRRSNMGLQFRAMSDNQIQFTLTGNDALRVRSVAFGLAGVLAGAASLSTAYDLGFDYRSGLPAVLLALVAAVTGGRGTFLGPVIGGVLLGVLRAGVVWWFGARWQDAVTFVVLSVLLIALPNGMLGRAARLEAQA